MFSVNNCKKIYILGIGGSSMQAIAKILVSYNNLVSGYDGKFGDYYKTLGNLGISVDISPSLQKIKECDILIYSLAFSKNFPAIEFANKHKKIVLNRKEFLKILSENFKEVVAISGTHGKSTTTYLTSLIFKNANFPATYHIGATSNEFITGGLHIGNDYFVTEACEYKDCFLALHPTVAVILNVERDHPDYFTSYEQLINSFCMFCSNIRDNGLLITSVELKEIFKKYLIGINRCDVEVLSIGNNGDFYYKIEDKNNFSLYNSYGLVGKFTSNLIGYNIYNTIVSIIIALHYKIDITTIYNSIKYAKGLARRYENKGKLNGCEVIVDYAHHPSEIKAVISASKDTLGKLVVVFQPHTYSRTEALFDDFATCFNNADEVIITKTFKSRENSGKTSAFQLFLAVSENVNAKYYDDFISIAKYLKANIKKEDRLLILGAGDINELANMLV